MDVMEYLKFDLHKRYGLTEKRPGIAQVTTPFYYADGDMLDIFVDMPRQLGGPLVISDHGCTFMRLSCVYEVSTSANSAILADAAGARGVELRGDVLRLETTPEVLYADLTRFAQAVSEISALPLVKESAEQINAA